MIPEVMEQYILSPGNYYGSLEIRMLSDGTLQWAVENYDGYWWEEISAELYELLKTTAVSER